MHDLTHIHSNHTILRWNEGEDIVVLPTPELESNLLNEITHRILESNNIKFGISNDGVRQSHDQLFYQCLPTIGRYAVSPSNLWNHQNLVESKAAQKKYSTRREIAYRLYVDGHEIALIFTPSMKNANIIIFESYHDFNKLISTFPDSIHNGGWTKDADEILRRINSIFI